MIYARQSTAIIVTVGPVLDADGVAVTDGVVADFKVSKNGAAPAALNGSATLTHRHTGHYSLSLTATDVNTVGTAEIVIDDTVNACPMKEIQVVEPVVYDALFADTATGMLPANVIQWLGTAVSTPTVAGVPNVNAKTWNDLTTVALPLVPTTAGRTLTIEADGMAHADLKEWLGVAPLALSSQQVQAVVPVTQKVDVETIKTRAVTAAGAVVVGGFVGQDTAAIGVNASGHVSRVVLVDTITTYTGNTPQTGDSYVIVSNVSYGNSALNSDIDSLSSDLGTLLSRVGTPANLGSGASIALNLQDIEAQTDDIGVAGAGLTAADDAILTAIAALNNITAASVWAVGTRTLSALDEDTTTLDLDATIRSAVGLASANLDTQIDDLPTNAELATALGTADDAVLAQVALVKAKTDLLPEGPAKNTAFTYVIKMVDSTDHVTPKTGLTVTMTRSLDGAAFGAATGTVTEISTGHYKVVASAADMNGDTVTHRFTGTAADDFTMTIVTTA